MPDATGSWLCPLQIQKPGRETQWNKVCKFLVAVTSWQENYGELFSLCFGACPGVCCEPWTGLAGEHGNCDIVTGRSEAWSLSLAV